MQDEHSRAGSPHMTRLGPALAEALLAGEWEHGAMLARAKAVLVRAPRRLPELVRDVRSAYPKPPLDAGRELAAFIDRVLVVGPRERPRVVRRMPYDADMVRRPWPVAPLATPQDLAALLGVDAGTLAWLADVKGLERHVDDNRLRHYRWTFTPRDGGRPPRPIAAPKQRLKVAQRIVLREILDRIPGHDAAHGFVRGRSALSNAEKHVGRRVVLHFDLEDFFPSVGAGRVYGIFRTAGYPEAVAHVLTGLATTIVPLRAWDALPRPTELRAITAHHRLGRRLAQPHLPQGAPTSPALANLAAHRLDRRLSGLASAFGATYTRYADDLVLSGDDELLRRWRTAQRAVAEIAADEGLRLQERKTRLTTRAGRQQVTGVTVNARANVSRREVDHLRAVLHDAATNGPEAANRAGVPDFRRHLHGRVAWVTQVNAVRGARLREKLDAIAWD